MSPLASAAPAGSGGNVVLTPVKSLRVPSAEADTTVWGGTNAPTMTSRGWPPGDLDSWVMYLDSFVCLFVMFTRLSPRLNKMNENNKRKIE